MATYRVSSTGAAGTLLSIVQTNSAQLALRPVDNLGLDTLIIDNDAFVIHSGNDADPATGHAVFLDPNGTWAVTVNGSIYAADGTGLFLAGGNVALSTITIGADGFIFGSDAAITTGGRSGSGLHGFSPTKISNAGSLLGDIAIHLNTTGNHSVVNTGTLTGTGGNAILNEATGSGTTVTNSGLVSGNIHLSGGTNSVTNSGSIAASLNDDRQAIIGGAGGDTVTNTATGFTNGGINLGDGTNVLSNAGTVDERISDAASYVGGSGNDAVTNTGRLSGWMTLGAGGINSLSNSGSIGVDSSGVSVGGSGATTLTNTATGRLSGGINVGPGTNKLTNAGSIGRINFPVDARFHTASFVAQETSNDTVVNSGTLQGWVNLGVGTDVVTNSGSIGIDANGNSIVSNGVKSTVTNSAAGKLLGGVNVAAATNSLTNAGTIGKIDFPGDASYDMASFVSIGAGNDTVTNSGQLTGWVNLDDGTNKLTNTGTIGDFGVANAVRGGGGQDTIANSGRINGGVSLGGGNDTFTNFITNAATLVTTNGYVGFAIDLGAGNDTFDGGANAEQVRDGDGADSIKLGGGNDSYFAVGAAAGQDGNDIIDGGSGSDTYYTLAAPTAGVFVNLDTIAHDEAPSGIGTVSAAANQAYGDDVAGALHAFNDTIKNFENVRGTNFADVIFGSASANRLAGQNGDDRLWGFGGNDDLQGGNGADKLIGGAGKDSLTGGADADVFVFLATTDSGIGAAAGDTIMDFEQGLDTIDVQAIDANSTVINNQDFRFIGSNVVWDNSGAGQLRVYQVADGLLVEGEITGDKKADFSILVKDATHTLTLAATDFVGLAP